MQAHAKPYPKATAPLEPESEACVLDSISGDTLQARLLEGVSRTFALTIPQLPEPLLRVVSNAYLLCRIVDTIEDEPALTPRQKRQFTAEFARVVAQQQSAETFSARLAPLLSSATIAAEHELIRHTPAVIQLTRSFTLPQQAALQRCVQIMAEGMADFQEMQGNHGLRDLPELDRYCYVVAGVVGEMLTDLFCDYSPAIGKHGKQLRELGVSFGQGLQMTNILKDLWEDRQRGACWLPEAVFREAGFELRDLRTGVYQESFGRALTRLIAIAHGHLHNAVTYTLLIPRQETGIRNFCCWAIGMAALTLRRINANKRFTAGDQVKISRTSVKAVIVASRLTAGNDRLLRLLFFLTGLGLPRPPDAIKKSFT